MLRTQHPFFLKRFLYTIAAIRHFEKCGISLEFPLTIQIQTQSRCTGSCPICPYSAMKDKFSHGVMAESLFKKIADEAMRERYFMEMVFMLQNEPLLDKRTFWFIQYVKSIGKHKKCSITTTGEFFDEFTLNEIKKSGVDHIMISINAFTKEMFEAINKGIDYNRVMKNIELLMADNILRKKIILKYVVTEQNKHEVRQAERYWTILGMRLRISDVSNRGGALDSFEAIRPQYKNATVMQKARQSLNRYIIKKWLRVCPFPFFMMNILHNGEVIFCCNDWRRAIKLGNVSHCSIKDIWNSLEMNQVRSSFLEYNHQSIKTCASCSMLNNLNHSVS